jgi:hypothetical protein
MAKTLEAVDIPLDDDQRAHLQKQVYEQLSAAIAVHAKREEKLRELSLAYSAKPKHAVKNFPWPNASNLVIPIVAITVDNVVARLMKSFLGVSNPIECIIKSPSVEFQEKDFRDWANLFLEKSGARKVVRDLFLDLGIAGTAYVKVLWESRTRKIHSYQGADVVGVEVTDYEGPVWYSVAPEDFIYPEGFDTFNDLPWVAERIRFTWMQLKETAANGMYSDIDDELKAKGKKRDDSRFKANQEGSGITGDGPVDIYEMYELWGKWEIIPEGGEGEPEFVEGIVTFSMDDMRIHRAIYNPFFGHARHYVRVPFLHKAHQIDGLGLAEMSLPFQEEASTAHNQVIDAATASIAGIIVRKGSVNMQDGEEIYPGKQVITDDPTKDLVVVHLSEGRSSLPNVEQGAAFWNEKRTGVSAYSMGVESPIAGSRATATGTTALINEGNTRFWVSIDDMRDALVDVLYLTLQIEQQMRPEGIPFAQDRMLTLPQGDLREMIGLRLAISSEKVNQDIEIQSFQMIISIVNEYYMRLMQAVGMIINPMIPPPQVMVAIQVMEASANLIIRLLERFDIENVQQLVPRITEAINIMKGALGPPPMGGPPGIGPQALPPGPGGGPPPLPPQLGGGGTVQ